MNDQTTYPHGKFCWAELCANDLGQAKSFYCELFQWTTQENVIDDKGNVYIMLQVDGKDIGAMYKNCAEQTGLPEQSAWLSYIAVDDVEASIAKIRAADGEVFMGPHDVFTAGRMALARDPQGAHFAIWQGLDHKGAQVQNRNNTICWNELATSSVTGAQKFYSNAFNWDVRPSQNPDMQYHELFIEDQGIGGMLEMTEEWGEVPPHWMVYFQVADCDASVEKAKSLGAEVCVPPTDIEHVGRFSVVSDPQGAVFSMIKLNDDIA
jgi:uncharacterized protein